MPHTEGFCFGMSDGSDIDDDLALVANARRPAGEGLAAFYTSWW
ncbi:hypothetical protein PZN02_006019 (plasmid) [Sinorhizobium garamanticum]|uniref:Uncharacterized protein n=1 Tax=Sinorhizobium garamanticum TaxID=680247 RepID=A0ABY8DPU2_9HYPH|nr:hypothetical protein [Sinorhizobium garamanticum]WEX91712.1 hypothetical protein PZN02_006019 [Sinorhizobium garamanticum]